MANLSIGLSGLLAAQSSLELIGTNVANATNNNYTIAAAAASDAGAYTGTVAGMGGATNSSAVLAVTLPPLNLSLDSTKLTDTLQFNLPTNTLVGRNYVLEVSTNLADPAQWMPVQTNTVDITGDCSVTVTNLVLPGAYFRVVLP